MFFFLLMVIPCNTVEIDFPFETFLGDNGSAVPFWVTDLTGMSDKREKKKGWKNSSNRHCDTIT